VTTWLEKEGIKNVLVSMWEGMEVLNNVLVIKWMGKVLVATSHNHVDAKNFSPPLFLTTWTLKLI
jgi:hypothetical protein